MEKCASRTNVKRLADLQSGNLFLRPPPVTGWPSFPDEIPPQALNQIMDGMMNNDVLNVVRADKQ